MRFFLPCLYLFCLLSSYSLSAQNLYFPPTTGDEWETITPDSLGWCSDNVDDLYQFLEDNNTKAFLLLKDGRIVLEKYFDSFQVDSVWYWASAGKSLTAFLIGIAQQEGRLSITDPTADYLGDWTNCSTSAQQQITIQDQLSMSTGLSDLVMDIDCIDPDCLNCLTEPGDRWAYHNGPYTLLQSVFEASMGTTSSLYIFQQIRPITGFVGTYVTLGYNKVFFSTPRNMARFGLLIQNRGVWENTPIMTDSAYFQAMISPSQQLNAAYGYLWWLNGQDSYMLPRRQTQFAGPLLAHAPEDTWCAVGKNGQYLNIVPSQGLVLIRMGDASDDPTDLVPTALNDQIWERLNTVICPTTTSTSAVQPSALSFSLSPNPTANYCQIQSDQVLDQVQVYDGRGQLLQSYRATGNQLELDLTAYPPAIYWISVESAGHRLVRKIVRY